MDGPFLTWGWRMPFLFSVVMVDRRPVRPAQLQETPVFRRAVENGERVKAPLGEVFRKNWRELILGTFIMLATYVLFYLMTTWILTYAHRQPGEAPVGSACRTRTSWSCS